MDSICKKENCTACGACLNACPVKAIFWKLDAWNYAYPYINTELCISCGLCRSVCPQTRELFAHLPLSAYAAWGINTTELQECASGGVARVLSKRILKNNGLVFACAYENGKNHHIKVSSTSQLACTSGSKYLWSDTEDIYSQVRSTLSNGIECLFIGTPCQVDGLKCYLGVAKNSNLLYTVDLICHGVPSSKYVEDYIKAETGEVIECLTCRDRSGYCLDGILKNRGAFHYPSNNLYLDSYLASITYRENCYSCRYAQNNRCGDITLGDYWGIPRELLPENAPDLCNIVFCNTQKGQSLVSACKEDLEIIDIPCALAISAKDNMNRPQPKPCQRKIFLDSYPQNGFCKATRMAMGEKTTQSRVKQLAYGIKSIIGYLIINFAWRLIHNILYKRGYLVSEEAKYVVIKTIGSDMMFSNYGTILQHYALRKTIERLGFKTIRYEGTYPNRKSHLVSFNDFKLFILSKLEHFGFFKGDDTIKYYNHRKRFYDFYKKKLGFRFEYYNGVPYAFVLGGDQVFYCWNNEAEHIFDKPKGVKRAFTYGASANWHACEKSEAWKFFAQKRLMDFSGIACREAYGRSLLSKLLPSKEVFHSIDPVFLMNKSEYGVLNRSKPFFSKPTLLCYLLHCDNVSLLHLDLLIEIAGILNCELRVIGLQGTELSVPVELVIDPSPDEFLSAINSAAFFITNSFHGCAFATIFQKRFVFFPQETGDTISQNLRAHDLLQKLGLTDKQFDINENTTSREVLEVLNANTNWQKVESLIEEWRNSSLCWLKERLND